ncbi:hypothetical protein AAF712_010834 [Marasmius tenuissimus]|uniref:Fungal-type protein kinase domain-containing protein n=1 Tax=Marasmius tenuissimus TaxID=585030 RepID=A0ABR2ZKS8_9AGAR
MPDAPKPSTNFPQYRNTPRKGDSTHHSAYTQGHTNQIRKTNMKTLGDKLPKFDVSYFLESVVPDVPEDKLDEVFQQLINKKILVYNATTEEHRWCWYDVDPSEMDGLENKVYKHLEDISEEVVKAAQKVWKIKEEQTVRFTCRPNHASLSDTQNSGFMTDGDQELIKNDNPNGGKDLLDSVTTAEFKKKPGKDNANDNVRKLLGNSTHMISSDPRRRFRFGITIEDAQMRFWYFSRALNFVTHDFNFITDPKPFIQFLLATSFATPEELGYDPTVVRLNVDGEWVYDYRVDHPEDGTQWYRTVESLDTHRAARLPGRGVRVWVVKPLDVSRQPYPPGSTEDKRYVLKDYWLAMDSDSESKILEAIVTAATGVDGRTEADIRKHLMTIERDWAVSVNGRDDNSGLHLRSKMPPSEHDEHDLEHDPQTPPTQPQLSSSVNSVPTGGLNIPEEKSQNDVPAGLDRPRVFEPRVHRRLIFKEVGQPLNKIRDQKVLAQCLAEALEGLNDFYRAGYVHRDVSSGNLLLCKLDGGSYICKISDLEYARPRLVKKKANSKAHDGKTGTPAFMAVEVQVGDYAFGPQLHILTIGNGSKPQFLHNYLHDVEGLWWIMLYSLFSTGPAWEALPSADDLKHRKARKNQLFPNLITDSVTRHKFMTNARVHEQYMSSMPRPFQALAADMTNALVQLMKLHQYAGLDILDHDSFKDVYRKLLPFFQKARESGVESVLPLEELIHRRRADGQPTVTVTPPASLKRSHATAQAGDDDEYVGDSKRAPKNRKTAENASMSNGASSSSSLREPRRSTRLAQ